MAERPKTEIVRADRAAIDFARRRVTMTAGDGFYIESVSAAPPRAVWRQTPPSGEMGGAHFDGETHGLFLLLPGEDRPRVGAPMAERLDWLAAKFVERAPPGSRTPFGVAQEVRRDAMAVFQPFLVSGALPEALSPGLAKDSRSHFILIGTAIGHIVVHGEMVRRGGAGGALNLEDTIVIAQGRVQRLRAANGLTDGFIGPAHF